MNQNLFNKLSELGLIATVTEMHEIKMAIEKDNQEEFEEGQRQADWLLEEDDLEDNEQPEECEVCGKRDPFHLAGCPYNDPLAYNEVGYG
jgi:hypothetical protein